MKRHILLPVVLLIYLAIIAYFTYPSRNISAGEISYTQYYISIGVTLVIIAALFFFLKKKAENERKRKDKK
jgi:phosphotransferase system  glucose/maltose/N-acetylglucosamine-specific IIC component